MTAVVTILVTVVLVGVALVVGRLAVGPMPTRPVADVSEWIGGASCTDMAVGGFFSAKPSATVRSICATCPVRSQCYQFAQANQMVGYWGGTTTAQRRGVFSYARYLFATARGLLRVGVARVLPSRAGL